jgi:hypothetical protein
VSGTDDYPGEMPVPSRIDDATAEALFAGRAVHPDLAALATAVQALRDVSQQPAPPPSAALAAMMAAGAFPAPAEAPSVRQRFLRVVGTLRRQGFGRVRGLRLAARLGVAGLAVGVVGFGSAGFAGSLPEPAQQRFESVVESVTPFRFAERPGGEAPARLPGVPPAPGDGADPADPLPLGPDGPGGPGEVPGAPPTQVPADPPGQAPVDPPGQAPVDPPAGNPGDPPGPADPPGPPADPPGGPPDEAPAPAPPGGGPPGPPGHAPGPPGQPPGESGERPGQGGR